MYGKFHLFRIAKLILTEIVLSDIQTIVRNVQELSIKNDKLLQMWFIVAYYI